VITVKRKGSKVKPEVTSSLTGIEWKRGGHVFFGGKPLTSGEERDHGLRKTTTQQSINQNKV